MGKRRGNRLRDRVEARAGGRCEYCHAPQSVCGYRFHLEHVAPRVAGGSHDDGNRALACAACNLAKGDATEGVDPETNTTTPLFNPRVDNWTAHFEWRDDCQRVFGRTPLGRATVAKLNMNDEFRIASRELWFEAGLLPRDA